MKYLMIAVLLLVSTGCATVYPECEEYDEDSEARAECQIEVRDWRRAIDLENYDLCVLYYSRMSRGYMIHDNHHHGKRSRVSPLDIKFDLLDSNCEDILGESWAEY